MKTLHLHGFLKEKYGDTFTLDVLTPAEAVRALCAQLPGFETDIRRGNWHVLRGALEDQDSLDEEGITVSLGHETDIHLLPAVEGANSGALMTVVGIGLIVAGVFTGGTSSSLGIALIAGGAGMVVSCGSGRSSS